jgi:undecaprenyl-diphosphatase
VDSVPDPVVEPIEPVLGDPETGAPQPHEAGAVARFDDAVDRALDPLRGNPTADRLFYALTELADFSLLWHLVGFSRALPARGEKGDRLAREAVELSVVLGLESLLVNQGVKSLFRRKRPVHEGDRPHHLRTPLTSSFPSGHASAAFCAAAVLSRDKRLAVPAYALAGLVATSRVYVRIHHASDVAGGVVVGTALGLAARKVLGRRARRRA